MFAQHLNDITAAWIALLLDEYEQIRRMHPQLVTLRQPNLAISDQCVRRLGEWNPGTRTITLSHILFLQGSWEDVVATLKHEMAHQMVSELYRIHDDAPHGAAFKTACAILGIEARATATPAALAGDQAGRVHEKVRKLLALAGSSNQHEAERALSKAHELALKYNIDMGHTPAAGGYAIRPVGGIGRRTPSYIWGIMGILDDFYFVLYIRRPVLSGQTPGSHRPAQVIELYGRPENLDVAEYVYYFLLRHGEQEWQAYKKRQLLPNNRQKISFLNGLYAGFRQQLAARHQALAEEKSLIWLGDPALGAFYRRRNPHVRKTTLCSRTYDGARRDGTRIGETLRLRHGLSAPAARAGVPAGLLNR